MPTKHYPSIDYVRQCFRYEDGRLFWIPRPREHFKNDRGRNIWTAVHMGKEAGGLSEKCERPRWVIGLNDRLLYRYRIVWALFNGEWAERLDHIDRDQLNDRIENLRVCSQSQNSANERLSKNNTSGFKGVTWSACMSKWAAQIMVNRRSIYLGCFEDPADAHAAYVEAGKRYFGDFHHAG